MTHFIKNLKSVIADGFVDLKLMPDKLEPFFLWKADQQGNIFIRFTLPNTISQELALNYRFDQKQLTSLCILASTCRTHGPYHQALTRVDLGDSPLKRWHKRDGIEIYN